MGGKKEAKVEGGGTFLNGGGGGRKSWIESLWAQKTRGQQKTQIGVLGRVVTGKEKGDRKVSEKRSSSGTRERRKRQQQGGGACAERRGLGSVWVSGSLRGKGPGEDKHGSRGGGRFLNPTLVKSTDQKTVGILESSKEFIGPGGKLEGKRGGSKTHVKG